MSNHDLTVAIFLQLATLLTFVRVVARVAVYLGQPPVVGEMIAGFLIGPSFFQYYFPDSFNYLFPKESIPILYVMAQLGLVMYMFLVGAEFDLKMLRERKRAAFTISLAGILAPFLLGGALGFYTYDNELLFSPNAGIFQVVFFTGAAMSITAFPMLARIIRERGLTHSSMGTLSLAAGSLDDAAAWCILAVVVGLFSGSPYAGAIAIVGGVFYLLFCLLLVRPLLRRFQRLLVYKGRLKEISFAFLLILLSLGAWFTDYVGIYAVFGAFILGASLPRGVMTRQLPPMIEPLAKNYLLPLFFVYAGLNMRLNIFVNSELLVVCIMFILSSCVGKFLACSIAAKIVGESTRSSLGIGALMNARGLMELILLNIALENGIITNGMFTIGALMAVITTLMATPLFNLVTRKLYTPSHETCRFAPF